MASSSSPSSSSSSYAPKSSGGWAYDVFLSFRGEDTRYNFVDHLNKALGQSGLTVFKDDEKLREGTEISPGLLEAIKESMCAVVVVSKNYANSSWCLVELAKIIECRNQLGQLVIPVFYHVDPSEVRSLKRNYETAFQQHGQKIRTILIGNPGSPGDEKFNEEMDKVNKWMQALKALGNLVGHHITETRKEGESSFIDKIVQSILDHIQPSVNMENNPIGIKYPMKELESLLDLESTQEVRIIGICGMGGIGKTTITRALFRRISCKFEGSSFVNDVRENCSDICALQERILKNITNHKSISKIADPENGAEIIKRRLSNKKVLLVLDDVDNVKQLKFLAATRTWFGAGSRIIITTRDQHVLDLYTDDIYKPCTLPKEQALELFSRHAFHAKTPPEGYEKLSDRAICYTGGLPLALEVLGSLFRGEQECVWDSALCRLAERPEKGIYEPLKISFDGLCDLDKEIFLDIACFFKGCDKERVTRKLGSIGLHPVMGINVLTKRSLITVSRGRIHMHDVLQEMGWEIVRERYPNTRLWQHEEICCLKINQNLEAVKRIVHRWRYGYENVRLSGDVFEKMNNIRLLATWGYFTSCEPTTFPDKLRWLRWNWYPFSSLPVAHMRKLVGLDMHQGEIKHLWTEYEHMPCLKIIRLSDMSNIKSLPDVSGAVNLERLIVIFCTNLMEIHKSLGTLKKLAYLDLSYCSKFQYLPSMEDMPLLKTIELNACYSLERFPEVSSSMVNLSNIHLDECSNLKKIPNSICELKNLKILHLQDCGSLQDLPEELGSMGKLEELLLGFTDDKVPTPNLPHSINLHALTKLCCLRKLDLSWRQMEEQDFPKNFHEFSSLEELHLSGNYKLVRLPESISGLSSLKRLELNDCQQLQSIQGLPSTIQVLKARDCIALKKIEGLSKEYASLHTIFLPGCKRLLENHENKAHLDEMLRQSFVKKCIAVDSQLSIWIPGNMIPSWFKEQHHDGYDIAQELGSNIPNSLGQQHHDGYEIAVKLSPQRHTSIMGFVVCVIFEGIEYKEEEDSASPTDWIEHENEDSEISASPTDRIEFPNEECETVSMVYIPESVFWGQMNDDFGKGDWSLLVESGRSVSITVETHYSLKVKSCGAYIVYKEDLESIQQIKIRIPDYGDSEVRDFYVSCGGPFFRYGIKFRLGS